jgi:hypothetical protein
LLFVLPFSLFFTAIFFLLVLLVSNLNVCLLDFYQLTREADTACAELFGEEEEEEDGNEEFSDAPDFFAPSDLLQHNNPASPVSQTSFTPSVPVAPAPTSSLVRFAQQQAAYVLYI